MRVRSGLVLLVVLLAMGLGALPVAHAQATTTTHTGTLVDGATWQIRVPAEWNGTLLLYSRGYRPPGSPNPAQDVSDPVTGGWLLDHGFALAGSSYASTGWAVKEALADQTAVLDEFEARVGRPRQTIAWGDSLGGMVTAGLVQRVPGRLRVDHEQLAVEQPGPRQKEAAGVDGAEIDGAAVEAGQPLARGAVEVSFRLKARAHHGKREVQLVELEPVGNYAVRIRFDDLHEIASVDPRLRAVELHEVRDVARAAAAAGRRQRDRARWSAGGSSRAACERGSEADRSGTTMRARRLRCLRTRCPRSDPTR